jgi:co-chaperonin GroES (HSP10)
MRARRSVKPDGWQYSEPRSKALYCVKQPDRGEAVSAGGEVIRAVQDFVILIPDAIERVTKAGIIMPNEVAEDAALRKPVTGKVVAMGPLCTQNRAKSATTSWRTRAGKYSSTRA